MTQIIRALVTVVTLVSVSAPLTAQSEKLSIVVFETEQGTIEMELDSVRAPARPRTS